VCDEQEARPSGVPTLLPTGCRLEDDCLGLWEAGLPCRCRV